MQKENITKFIDDHKIEIIIIVGVGTFVLGGFTGWKAFEKIESPKRIAEQMAKYRIRCGKKTREFLSAVNEYYPHKYKIIRATLKPEASIDKALTLDQLGKFGFRYIRKGFPEDMKITHILAIGPSISELHKNS